jgi:hypothetical protein
LPNLCPTNINDFKQSINHLSARRCELDRSRIARVLLAPCSRAARSRSTSRPPRVAPALHGPALRGPALRGPAVRSLAVRSPAVRSLAVRAPAVCNPAVRAPAVRSLALRAPKIETQGTTSRSSFGMETQDSAEAQKRRGKGLGWSDDENLALCRAAAGVSQDTVRGAGMRQAQYARRIMAEFIRTLHVWPRPALRMGREVPSIGDAGTAGRACRAGNNGRKSRRRA